MNMSQFKACNKCMGYEQLLHYTSINVLKIMLNERTLKCNSLKNVNDRMERKRIGIEDLADTFYVSCFCHYQYEIVPFWFMYGSGVPDDEKVLLRFGNFATNFNNVIENDWAITGDGKRIYFDPRKLFICSSSGFSSLPINDLHAENRQTIKTVRLFDIDYLPPDDEAFIKNYKTQGGVSFGEGQDVLPVAIKDARSIGKQKTIHWEYEAETRIGCMLNSSGDFYFGYILLRLRDVVFKDMVIVANPWASDDFISTIKTVLSESSLSRDIKKTIVVRRSELDGQIVGRDR